MNKATLEGRLGKDPIITTFPSGSKVAKFSMAINEKYKSKGVDVEETTWLDVETWNANATKVEAQFKKGSFVKVEGSIKIGQYFSNIKNTNEKTIVIKAFSVELAVAKPQAAARELATAA